MPVRADPTAHFKQFSTTVTLCEVDFVIPAAPASTWLVILTEEELDGSQIIPGMLSQKDQERLDDLLLSGELTIAELSAGIRDVITTVSGHAWWWTLGLVSVLRGEGGTQVLGEMSRIRADKVSLANWLNSMYALMVRHMKEQDKAQFDAQLDSPPAGVEIDPEEMIDEAAATASFFGMMNQTNG